MTHLFKRAQVERNKVLRERKLNVLKKLDPKLFKELIQPRRPIMVKDPEGVAFLATDILRFKKKMKAVPEKPRGKKKDIDPQVKIYADKIMTQPVVLNVEPEVKEIFDSCKTPEEHYRMQIIVIKQLNGIK